MENNVTPTPSVRVNPSETIAATINKALPNVKIGTLRMWGWWFGRPYDNLHSVIEARFDGDLLIIGFNEGEILRVWEPTVATVNLDTLRIHDAKRVRWEWFYYGRMQTDANRYFVELSASDVTVTADTNVDWYKPQFNMDRSLSAVELL